MMQWWVVAVSRRSHAVPSGCVDVLDRGDILRSGDTGDATRLRRFPPFFPFSLFSLGSGAWWTATRWRRGDGRTLGLWAWLYSPRCPSSIYGGRADDW